MHREIVETGTCRYVLTYCGVRL